jgi:hypothetical protein
MPAVINGLVSPVMASEGSLPPLLPGIVTGAWNPGAIAGKSADDSVIPAKLSIASIAPTEQRPKARKIRGLKRPEWEVDFFFMMI